MQKISWFCRGFAPGKEREMVMQKKGTNRNVVLVAGMLIQLCAGIIYMWSVFRAPVAQHLGWAAQSASLTSSIMLATFVVGIVIGGRIQDKIGPTKVTLAGSIIFSLGMVLTSLVTPAAPWLVYVTYGVIGGFGVGAVYTTTVSLVQKWFPDKRGLATGMMVSSFGFSLVIFAPAASALLASSLGVPGTFLAIGLLFLVVCSLCSLLIKNPPEDYAVAGKAAAASGQQHYTTGQMLKTKQFYLIAVSMMCLLSAYFILNPLFKDLGQLRGLSEGMATLGVMITGIASASGRLLFSWASDAIGRKGAILAVIVITLCAVLGLIVARGVMFLVCIAAIACAFGGSAGVYPAITADHFGTRHMGLNYGCVMVGFGLSALLFPLLSNALVVDNNYTWSFVVSGAACVVAIVLLLLLKKPHQAPAQNK